MFDDVPLLVAGFVECWDLLAGWIWVDDRDGSTPNQERPEGITVIGCVGELVVRRGQAAQLRDREPAIACLPGARVEVDQTTNCVCHGVDFGRAPPSAATDRLLLSPHFPLARQRWALLVVLSIESAATLSKALIRRNIFC